MTKKSQIQEIKDRHRQPTVSIITRCKGRKAALSKTLPFMLGQNYPYLEVIIVNYNSPDGLHEWLVEEYPKLIKIGKLVEVFVPKTLYFHHAHSRNVGLKAALGDWVLFVDADCQPNPNLVSHLLKKVEQLGNVFACIGSPAGGRSGTLFARREDLMRIGGYNEILMGWGYEDGDIRDRLFMIDREMFSFSPKFMGQIHHPDHERWMYMEPPYNRSKGTDWRAKEKKENFVKSEGYIREHGFVANKDKEWGAGGQVRCNTRWIYDIWHDDKITDMTKALDSGLKGLYFLAFDKDGNCLNEQEMLKKGMPKSYIEMAKRKKKLSLLEARAAEGLTKLSGDQPMVTRSFEVSPEPLELDRLAVGESDVIVEIEDPKT